MNQEKSDAEVLWEIFVDHDPDEVHPEDQAKCKCGEVIGYRENYAVITNPYGHLIELLKEWVQEQRAGAWDSCVEYAPHTSHERKRLKAENPYK